MNKNEKMWRKLEAPNSTEKVSTMPISNPAITAPGKLVSPPTTLALKAFKPYNPPMVG